RRFVAGLYPPGARGWFSTRRLCGRAALDRRRRTRARAAARALKIEAGIPMTENEPVAIRHARRHDCGTIVAMLADDPLGSARERIQQPLPEAYLRAFDA